MLTITSGNKPSKSQKRKQRLLNKGKQLVIKTAATPAKTKKKRSRAKARSSNLKDGNPTSYISSLMDPEHGEGAKIPDLVAFPSGTLQLMKEGVLATGATAGDSVSIRLLPIIGNGSSTYPLFIGNNIASGSFATVTNTSWSARAAAAAAYDLFRPVSASIEVYFIGNSTSDGGRMCGGCFITGINAAVPTTFSQLEDRPETDTWPQRNGMRVCWKPLDESNFIYADANGGAGDIVDPYTITYPVLMIGVTGLPVNATNIGYKVVCNFEAIPSLAYYDMVETTPSPFNQQMLRRAFEWAAESGNNIAALANNASPYIQTGMNLLQAGTRVANALGYNPLPQRHRVRGRAHGIAGPLSRTRVIADRAVNVEGENGKDEEDFAEAERKFSQLNISSQSSTERAPERGVRIGSNTPISSPSLARKFSGQG
jgi:hypothetical protein